MKIIGNPSVCGDFVAVDIEVGGIKGTHSYQIKTRGSKLVRHNSVSLLGGATPGVHFPTSRCYIRRVRVMKKSPLLSALISAGYKVEPAIGQEKSTMVVEFPIKLDDNIRTAEEVSVWEKLHLAAFMQEHWADNQVSLTADFDAETEGTQLQSALNYFQYKLKSVSFLPRSKDKLPYPQMPYEAITVEQYQEAIKNLKPVNFSVKDMSKENEQEIDAFCDSETCVFGGNKKQE